MTFWRWLKRQRDREDPVGDLSRDALADKHPKGVTQAWWLRHLRKHGACDGALRALKEAWREYADSGESADRKPYCMSSAADR